MIVVMLGKLRSGKSASTEIVSELFEKRGVPLIRKPLATPIYKEAEEFYTKHGLVWRKNRKLLEGIGEAFNEDYPNGDKIVEIYSKNFNPKENIIVEDCRRLTQTDFFTKHRACFIRIQADDLVRKSRCAPGEWSEGHVTDTELDDFVPHFIVDNNHNDKDKLFRDLSVVVDNIFLRNSFFNLTIPK